MVYHKTEKVMKRQQTLKDRILEAAREMLAEKESGNTTIKDIAKRAGIATGTFYLYFANKEALIDSVVKEVYMELLEIIKKERAQYAQVSEKLQASIEVCVRIFLREKHLGKILLDHFPQINTTLSTKFTHIEKDLIQFVQSDLDELMEKHLIPEQDTKVSATAFVGTFRQVILSWISNGEPDEWEKAYRTLLDYNMRGIGIGVTNRVCHENRPSGTPGR